MSNKNVSSRGILVWMHTTLAGVYVVRGSAESVAQSRETRSARPARRLTMDDMIRVPLEF